jgi:hypothetical protein
MKARFTKTALATVFAGISSVSSAQGIPPAGWTLKEQYTNVRIYKDMTGGFAYTQIVDIRSGGKLRFIQPGIQYGSWGSYPKFTKYTLDTLWNYSPGAVSMINGQFFNTSANPTTMSFGVKSNDSILTQGQDINSGSGGYTLKQIQITDNVGVSVTTGNNIPTSGAQNIIAGLDPRVNKSRDSNVGRTYLCSKNNSQWLVIMSNFKSTQSQAETMINAWGCDSGSLVMFDGSGSTQLKSLGGIRLYGSGTLGTENRNIAQALAIYN